MGGKTTLSESSANPATPASGYDTIFFKSNEMYWIDSTGTVHAVSPASLSTPVAIAFADSPYTIAALTTGVFPWRSFLVSTAGGAVQANLPTVPVSGEIITFKRTTSDGTTFTIGRNGQNIEGAAANFIDNNAALSFYSFQYSATGWWLMG